jgi:hypothetical protein
MLYYLYIKNLIENWVDLFFCNFFDIDFFENYSDFLLFLRELVDIFKYFLNFQFEEFFFFIRHLFFKYQKKYSIFFYFFSLISDVYLMLVTYMVSHLWLSTKIYNDYVHNYYRRNFLKILSVFFLIFSLLFLSFYFFI